jgi:hypothetical protein
MAHTGPSNAITKESVDAVPKDKWIQLTITYDGSSKAAGFKLYMDGSEMKMETTMDQLTRISCLKPGQRRAPNWRMGAG